jgi:hypothetical protein
MNKPLDRDRVVVFGDRYFNVKKGEVILDFDVVNADAARDDAFKFNCRLYVLKERGMNGWPEVVAIGTRDDLVALRKAHPPPSLIDVFGFDRTKVIRHNHCVPPPIGCGQPVTVEEFRDEVSLREYRISGFCQKCQDALFGE